MCFAFLLAISMASGCAQRVSLEAEQANVKSTVDQFVQVWTAKDTTLRSRIMAHGADMVTFGTGSTEYWVGWEQLRQGVQSELAAMDSVRVAVRNQVIKIDPSGTIAWFSE